MSISQFTKEQLSDMSLIDAAYEIMISKKHAVSFKDLWDELCNILDFTEEEAREKVAQFYTDLNIDGRFLPLGENNWALKSWYPIDQIDDEIVTHAKAKKKKKGRKGKMVEDVHEDFDELDEEDLEFDDFDDYDEDEVDEDDLDLEDDLDHDLEEEDIDDDLVDFDEDEDLLGEDEFDDLDDFDEDED